MRKSCKAAASCATCSSSDVPTDAGAGGSSDIFGKLGDDGQLKFFGSVQAVKRWLHGLVKHSVATVYSVLSSEAVDALLIKTQCGYCV